MAERLGGMTTISGAGHDDRACQKLNGDLRAHIERLERVCGQRTKMLAEAVDKLKEALVQHNGGDADPRTCESHPGHILIKLGWIHFPDFEAQLEDETGEADHLGLHWRDPEEKGTGTQSLMCLSMALGIVYRRLEAKTAERLLAPSWMERVGADD